MHYEFNLVIFTAHSPCPALLLGCRDCYVSSYSA